MNVCLIFKNFKKVKNTHDVISKGKVRNFEKYVILRVRIFESTYF